ncbi:methyltransferase [Hwanghaeella grinnelliae]|uniref:Methyltransferase n=1 Tax=Hwanghaeella grinnelliae TaxID=2500179 RepID=A0A437QWJ3_9PROT|nr:class I SAM-dependent methyltransferase [Hwanghaeella grinnelliae]RVU38813.1 methyltransferase [Hwanghaeella grinnelliae]
MKLIKTVFSAILSGLIALYSCFFHILRPLRALIPESVRVKLRGQHTSMDANLYRIPAMALEQFAYRLRGKTYVEWYANFKEREADADRRSDAPVLNQGALERIYATGHEDLEILKALGLLPDHYLHEVGCGRGRTTQHLVAYLEPGHYSTNDLAIDSLNEAKTRLEQLGLMTRNPELLHTLDNSFSWLKRKMDFIWCYGVFTHMPLEDVAEILANARPHLKPGGAFLASFTAHVSGQSFRLSHKDWYFSVEEMVRISEEAGYEVEDISHLEPEIKKPRFEGDAVAKLLKLTNPS